MAENTTSDDTVVEAVELEKVFRDFWNREKVRAVNRLNFTLARSRR